MICMPDALGQKCAGHGRQGCLNRRLERGNRLQALLTLVIGGWIMTMLSESQCGCGCARLHGVALARSGRIGQGGLARPDSRSSTRRVLSQRWQGRLPASGLTACCKRRLDEVKARWERPWAMAWAHGGVPPSKASRCDVRRATSNDRLSLAQPKQPSASLARRRTSVGKRAGSGTWARRVARERKEEPRPTTKEVAGRLRCTAHRPS
jgi:hypothetical protein